MFIDKLKKENPYFLEAIFEMHKRGEILPDSYIVDMDVLIQNAKVILDEANKYGIELFFMLKQLGKNPYIAKQFMKLGYKGAVVVDFKGARVMMDNDIPIGNIGHLVQIPTAMMREVVEYNPQFITVYSLEKCIEINNIAKELRKVQRIIIKVIDEKDIVYPGQEAGIKISELESFLVEVKKLDSIKLEGITSFPCYLYNEKMAEVVPTNNLITLQKAVEICKKMGVDISAINTPSANDKQSMITIKANNGNYAEPGHGFTATTPSHRTKTLSEKICVAYLSEVSHNYNKKGYCFGGGYYRRSNVQKAIVGSSYDDYREIAVNPLHPENIDYHFELNDTANIGDAVIMAFRFQIFVTRSDVVLVKGISNKKPEIIGVYDSLGNKK